MKEEREALESVIEKAKRIALITIHEHRMQEYLTNAAVECSKVLVMAGPEGSKELEEFTAKAVDAINKDMAKNIPVFVWAMNATHAALKSGEIERTEHATVEFFNMKIVERFKELGVSEDRLRVLSDEAFEGTIPGMFGTA